MSKNEISSTEFFLCMNGLMAKSIPLLALCVSGENCAAKLYGFLDSATIELGLVFSSAQGTPSISSTLQVPIVDGCRFFREVTADLEPKFRERAKEKYGDTCLSMVMPSRARLMVFFTDSSK
jgi:hypothetical protein